MRFGNFTEHVRINYTYDQQGLPYHSATIILYDSFFLYMFICIDTGLETHARGRDIQKINYNAKNTGRYFLPSCCLFYNLLFRHQFIETYCCIKCCARSYIFSRNFRSFVVNKTLFCVHIITTCSYINIQLHK